MNTVLIWLLLTLSDASLVERFATEADCADVARGINTMRIVNDIPDVKVFCISARVLKP